MKSLIPYAVVIAQNNAGKSTLMKDSPLKWTGWEASGNNDLLCYYRETKYGPLHDVNNWEPYLVYDHDEMWKRLSMLHDAHGITFFTNHISKVEHFQDGSKYLVVLYKHPKDGALRWMKRDPTFFKSQGDAVMRVSEDGKKLRTIAEKAIAAGKDVKIVELETDQFMIDVLEQEIQNETQ